MGISDVIQYVLTALAGLAVGILGMRLWQSRDASLAAELASEAGGPDQAAHPSGPVGAWISRQSAAAATLLGRKGGSSNLLLLAAGGVLAAALAIHFLRGERDVATTGDQGVPLTASGLTSAQLDDVDTMIERLAARLEAEPDDGEGHRMLGWSYLMTDKPELALPAYQRALALLPEDASVHAGYGEVLVALADGTVTSEASDSFNRALALDPAEPRARYFKGLWDDQHGRKQQALDSWVALVESGPADAPWQAEVRAEITRLAGEIGVDPGIAPLAATTTPQLDPQAIAAADSLPADQREAMVNSMVSRLAARLRANPQDPEGWLRLIRSRMVMNQPDQARADLASARAALAGNQPALAQLRALASELRIPGT